MKSALSRTLCRLLIVLVAWTPFQIAQAGMISTDQSVASTAQLDRAAVMSFVERSDVATQLAGLGLDRATARDRVAAMSDQEVASLRGQIDSLPAGAMSHHDWEVLLVVVVVALVIWWAMKKA